MSSFDNNIKLKKTSFLSGINSEFINQLYTDYLSDPKSLPEGWKKDKDGKDVVGNIIKCKMVKSRFTKENKEVEVKLTYDKGLDRYYGLLDLALKYGIFKQISTRIELPDGTKTFGKSINKDPKKYFTPEILEKIDQAAITEYTYGKDEVYDDDGLGEDQG